MYPFFCISYAFPCIKYHTEPLYYLTYSFSCILYPTVSDVLPVFSTLLYPLYFFLSYCILHILHLTVSPVFLYSIVSVLFCILLYRPYFLYYCSSCILFSFVSLVSCTLCIICDKVLYSIKLSDSTVFPTICILCILCIISRCDKVPYSIKVSDSTVFSTQLQSSANQGCASLILVGSKLSHTKVNLETLSLKELSRCHKL